MRSLIISDVHANDTALAAVLDCAEDIDELWCLGDIVGYGAGLRDCLDLIYGMRIPVRLVSGNHDLAALDELPLTNFIPDGRAAIEWTKPQLTVSDRRYLNKESLIVMAGEDATILHGSPHDPVWAYVNSIKAATAAFKGVDTRISFFGHTHRPMVYYQTRTGTVDGFVPRAGVRIDLKTLGARQLINPGSIGQPRDGDPRPSFLVFDHEKRWVEFHRAEYDIGDAQAKILAAGLPPALADRLRAGL